MDTTMFCFQCEQTAGCAGCMGAAGVCGKTAATAQVQDELTGALVGLALTVQAAKAAEGVKAAVCGEADNVAMEGLFATLTNVDFDDASLRALTARAHAERDRIAAALGVEAASDYDLALLWNAPEDVRSLKSLVLFGLRGVAAYAYHAAVLGYRDEAVSAFLHQGLASLADNEAGADELLPLALRVGEVNLRCMELLDQANTETFGTPEPTQVARTIEPGPFSVVSGHDLLDLKLVLDQAAGRGVNVYTHGELLPAHAYPLFKQYPHLRGNLGTAWQNQREEFANLPAPILFTTNCLMPPAASYADRVFTTGPVAFPGMARIDANKDFGPVIESALELGGFAEPRAVAAEEGAWLTTGFGHGAILGSADAVVDAVKQGAISHFFLVGGCDGARPGRGYFRDFVRRTPADSVVLTLACGKFRFNDLDLGTVAGLPRLMDMGQCNDAYGAIRVAVALAEAFECGVNDLPLTLVLSWYEQKAVSILLSLLNLGIKGIYLGPTLPAFVSPGVLDVLVREFDVHPISTPEEDLAVILA